MPVHTTIALIVTLTVALAGFAAVFLLRRRSTPESSVTSMIDGGSQEDPVVQSGSEQIAYSTEAIDEASGQVLKLAFGVTRFDYQIFADHAVVLDLVEKAKRARARRSCD